MTTGREPSKEEEERGKEKEKYMRLGLYFSLPLAGHRWKYMPPRIAIVGITITELDCFIYKEIIFILYWNF